MYKIISVITVMEAFLLLLGTGKDQIQPPSFPENIPSADRTETSVPPVAMTMTAFSIEKTSWKITEEEVKGTEEALQKEIDDFHAMQTQAAVPTQRPTATPVPTNTPKPTAVSVKEGDIITFGHYEQDNNLTNGPEPIEWPVLAVENRRALLISKYGLDVKPYHEKYESITWENCSLRKWLNGDFYNNAFDGSEKSRIPQVTIENPGNPKYGTQGGYDARDYIFLLSIDEANQYFASDDDRNCQTSDYAKENGADVGSNNGNSKWWLRSPG